MNRLQQFVELLTGSFDNREQYEQMQKEGNQTFPLARHVNTACNDKITGLPQDFDGVFVLEESYYNVGERTNALPTPVFVYHGGGGGQAHLLRDAGRLRQGQLHLSAAEAGCL